jgi:CubicO group peptidase (beta-lactamase class C family)
MPDDPRPSPVRHLGAAVLASYHVSADGMTREVSGSLTPDLRFPIASVTKTLTALLAARLSIDGVVSWDDPLEASSDGQRPLSMRALLTHTAGLPFELLPEHWHTNSLTEPELTSALVHPARLRLPPNTWHYSNLGYALAARLLERATGQSYADLLAERVLRPLGMTGTSLPSEATEGPTVLGAAAPAGDLWSTLEDLMTLARAIDGHQPDVITWPMLALMLETAIPDQRGSCLGAGLRTHAVGAHRVLVSTGTIRDRTTCMTVWPRRGCSVVVAEAGYSHDSLRDTATDRWRRADTLVRTWWWDGQAVIELRHGDEVELLMRETTWPSALFSGRRSDETMIGVDWRGQPLELFERGVALIGTGMVLTADVSHSAFAVSEHQ